MFNFRGLVNQYTQILNPNFQGVLLRDTGVPTVSTSGRRTQNFTSTNVELQVQAVNNEALRQIDGLNLTGIKRSVILTTSRIDGVVRADKLGGDILQFPEYRGGANKNWRVVHQVKSFDDWIEVVVVMQ